MFHARNDTRLLSASSVSQIYFIIDVIINFRTAFYDESQRLIVDLKRARNEYLRGWFAIDIIGSLPVGYITLMLSDDSAGPDVSVVKILRLLKLSKLLRLARAKRLLERYEDQLDSIAAVVTAIVLPMIAIVYITHVLACMWFVVGRDLGVRFFVCVLFRQLESIPTHRL